MRGGRQGAKLCVMSRLMDRSVWILLGAFVLPVLGHGCSKGDSAPEGEKGRFFERILNPKKAQTEREPNSPEIKPLEELGSEAVGNTGDIKEKEVHDTNGKVMGYLPLPSSWTVNSEPSASHFVTGPDNLRVTRYPGKRYFYSKERFARESARMAKRNIAPVPSIEKLVAKYIEPGSSKAGSALVKSYPLPEVLDYWERFAASIPKTQSKMSHRVLGTDWKHADGSESFAVIVQQIVRQGSLVTWTYWAEELMVESDFSSAKNAFIYGLANLRMDEDWLRESGRKMMAGIRRNERQHQQRMQASARAHQQRMADIAAVGATSRAVGKINSDILDQSHRSFQRRTGMRDAGHAASVDLTLGRTQVQDPTSGKQYKVESGYKHYWSDGQGGYFGTNDALYDPRTDSNLANKNWTKFQPNR